MPASLGAIIALVMASAFLLSACGPQSVLDAACGFDPTDDCNWSVYVVRNDLNRPVVLSPCANHCGAGDDRYDSLSILPGETSPPKQYGGVFALTGDTKWYAVESEAGKTLGCLVLDGHSRKEDGYLVLVSQRERCSPEQPVTRPVGRTEVQRP